MTVQAIAGFFIWRGPSWGSRLTVPYCPDAVDGKATRPAQAGHFFWFYAFAGGTAKSPHAVTSPPPRMPLNGAR
jgi:hypothetical protein